MVDIAKYQTMERFIGVVNVDDANRLNPFLVSGSYGKEYTYPLQQANNIDIDDSFGLSSRPGYAPVLSGTDIQSLWAEGSTCLYVDGGNLIKLDVNYSKTILRSGLSLGARMSYAPWNDRVYYSNGYQIGYVKSDVSYSLVDPLLAFKLPLPAGRFVAYFNACLFVAKDDVLYISDPLCDYYDTRIGYRRFNEKITLLRPVENGLFVGDEKIYWIKGKSNEDFERVEAYSHRPIMYTDINIDGQHIGPEAMDGKVAMWTCDNGICMGVNSGNVVNLTESRYTFTATGEGAAFLRDIRNNRHYINSLY